MREKVGGIEEGIGGGGGRGARVALRDVEEMKKDGEKLRCRLKHLYTDKQRDKVPIKEYKNRKRYKESPT